MTPREHALRLAEEQRERVRDESMLAVRLAAEAEMEPDVDRRRLLHVKARAAAMRSRVALATSRGYEDVANGVEPSV